MCELHFIRFARLGYLIRFRNVWLFSYSLSTIVYFKYFHLAQQKVFTGFVIAFLNFHTDNLFQ